MKIKIKFLYAIILTCFISCIDNKDLRIKTKYFIRYDSLFKIIDSTKLEIIRDTDSAAIEVLDKTSKNGERGLLRFDYKNNLRSYDFLHNEHNDASFYLRFDSVGNHYRSTTQEVVQWTFYSPKDSTIKFSFLLCALDRNYRDIKIQSGKFIENDIILYESNFAKLIGANVTINKDKLDSEKKIYLTGRWQDKFTKEEQNFIDSTDAN